MQVPLEISYRGVEKTEDIERLIREKVDWLEKFASNLISCRVAVERPQKEQQSGNPYRVRIIMRVPPEKELVVKEKTGEGDMHLPLSTVIRSAFDAASTQLKKQVEMERMDIKRHPEQEIMALVDRLFVEEGYGFIRTPEGEEYYFHKNSVLHDDFDRLTVGTGVRFFPEMGEKGPQASSVQIVDKRPSD